MHLDDDFLMKSVEDIHLHDLFLILDVFRCFAILPRLNGRHIAFKLLPKSKENRG
jgi:hypothetical protein